MFFKTAIVSVFVLSAVAVTGISQTTNSVTIANYSFENPVVADGSYTTTLPGWSTAGSAVAFAIINPSAANWPSASPAGLDGANAGQIFMTAAGQSGIFYQDTGIKYVAGVTYQLTAAVGLQSNQTFDTNSAVVFYNSALAAIASIVLTPGNLTAGAFTNVTLTYTATGNEGGNGDVVIGFSAPPATTGSSYFDFDNVRLSAVYPGGLFITSQPVSQSTYLGQTNSFSVAAVGAGTLSYQWQATNNAGGGFTNLVNGGAISGATSNVLTIAGVTANWALAYQVIITNISGSVTSSVASLTILPGLPPFRLMILGDSISRGATDPNVGVDINVSAGFRDAIYSLNTNANVNFQFVGASSKQTSPKLIAAGQQYHNAYASYTTGSLFTNLTANVQPPVGDPNVGGYWMTSGSPGGAPVLEDVVTLLTGANDIGLNPGNSLQYFTNNELNLLGWFKTNRPNTKVIVATDTPRTDSTANNNAALAINQWITNNVPNLSTNFSTVDMYPLFIDANGNIKTHDSPDGISLQDGVHPTHNAYLAMGQAWFNAIQGALNPTAPNFLSATAGLNSQVTLTWTNVPGALGYNVKLATANGGPYSLVASNLSTASYTNNGLANGTVYYYVVSAVLSSGESPNSYQVNATPGTIPVFNHSFDNNYVAYANYLGSAPAGWTFNGTGNGQLAAVVFPASGDGRFANYPVPGLDGLNYAQIYVYGSAGSGTLSLNTGYSYVAGATYKLTAGFGIETGSGGGTLAPGAQLQLQNPSFTTLAATNVTSANTTANQFNDLSTTYTANGTEGNIVISLAIPAAVAGNAFLDVDNVRLTVVYPGTAPVITVPPVSQTNSVGNNATFNVVAAGQSPLGYQWQANGGTGFTNLVNGGTVLGAASNVLTIANLTTNWALAYRVIVTNSFGSVTSTPASLTVPWTNIFVAPGGSIQAAINQAYANGGGQVNLGAGTYYGNIVMSGGVTLNGAGSNTIIAASTISGPQNNPASGYTVQNLVIDGQISCSYFSIGATNVAGLKNVSGLAGLPGINGGNPSGSPASYNLTYRNLEIKNTSIAMQCWSTYGLVITNCNFHDNGIGFSHSIYLVGCPGFQIANCVSSWSRTGTGVHLDFASDGGYTNSFTQCEFDGEWGLGILDQAWNGSANYTKLKGCGIKYGGQGGGDGSGIDIDYTGDLQASRFEYNDGNGATIRGSTALLYDSFNGNASAPYFSYAAVSNNLVGGPGANIYHATLADGVTGPNNTADWVTTYGGQTEGAVDFNANHSLNGSLTWPNVSSTAAGSRQLSVVYANGASTNVTMKLIVNGGTTNNLVFPPTGGWSTYSTISSNVTLTAANNTVQMLISNPGATCPILSALLVNDSVPAVPLAPTGLTYLALTNAPKYDLNCWIRLSWNAVSGATYYNIQRNGFWIATGVPTNVFNDYHVPYTGSAFTYTVVPVNAGGSGTSTAITTYSLTGFPVVLTAVTNGPGSVALTCAQSLNATNYNVYRALISGGPYTFIGSTGPTTNIVGTITNVVGIYTDTTAPSGTNYYVMTANNGITESLYSPESSVVLTAMAPVSTNAFLTALSLTPGSLSPAFTSNTLSYVATAAYGSTPTVTVTNAGFNATNQLVYNGATNVLVSGVASSALSLNPNPAVTNGIKVQVTAQDGVTVKTYTVNVVQLPNQTKPVLTSGVNAGLLTLSWPLDHLGYRLLTQTNNLNLGVSANPNDWATVPGSTATNLLSLPILTTSRNNFYRLVYP